MPSTTSTWTSQKLRQTFLDYFAQREHTKVASSSLIPNNDPTLLFTNAGMVQFKEVFLGNETRPYVRATSSQRCVRAGGKHNDLDNVGYTARHHTFFEMLGNFSFGDYFKHEAISYAWEFLTKVLQIPAEKLWITVYETDTETAQIWLNDIKIDPARLSYCGASDNFWSMGEVGPCGPCTEIFYDHGEAVAGGPPGTPSADGDRYVEIWNIVFMEFNRLADGQLIALPAPSVDTGMGLERITCVMQGVHNNYDTDLFVPLIKAILQLAKLTDTQQTSARVIADHIRSCAFLIADGVIPANEGRGYVLRRIIRRAIRHGHHIGLKEPFFYKLLDPLIHIMGAAYPALTDRRDVITKTLLQEEEQFGKTLEQGFKLFNQVTENLETPLIPGHLVFKLYDTYGFPMDLTADMARERGLSIDEDGFEREMSKQRRQSQAKSQFQADYSQTLLLKEETRFTGYEYLEQAGKITGIFVDKKPVTQLKAGQEAILTLEQTPFYAESGGQVGDQGILQGKEGWFEVKNTQKQGQTILHIGQLQGGHLAVNEIVQAKVDTLKRRATALNHSATHLLNAALKEVLGSPIQQKGSLVEPKRLRFDFTHFAPLTETEIQAVEQLVNEHIRQNHLAHTEIMPIEEAKQSGAVALFGEKYGETVRVLNFGNFSKELCGGTHVNRTGDIGLFKIISETGVAAGIRRIEAITGAVAWQWVIENEKQLHQTAALLKSTPDALPEKLQQLLEEYRRLEKQVEQLQAKLSQHASQDLVEKAHIIAGIHVLAARIETTDAQNLRTLLDQLKQKLRPSVIILGCVQANKVQLIAGVSEGEQTQALHAGDLVNFVATQVGGKGGGRKDMAQAGGTNPEGLDKALESVYNWVEKILT
jgi:alanyl-tRNA synthetase